MFCSSIFPSERTGSMFLFEFRLTNRISSWSITSSIDNKSSYCPVTADSSSSRNVMHSLIRPWILGTRSRSSSDCVRFFTLISKCSRCWAGDIAVAIEPVDSLVDLFLQHALVEQHDNDVVEVV